MTWLHQGPVAIVGCGGLGVPAAWTFAQAGIGKLRLVDDDRVEASNLHRQIAFSEDDLGRPKAEVLADWLRARRPALDVEVVLARAAGDLDEVLGRCQAVFDGTDDAHCKFATNDWAVAAHRRWAVIASAIDRRGQWLAIEPGAGGCYRCLFEEPPANDRLATCASAGILGPVVGMTGALAAQSLVRILRGEADPAVGALVRFEPRGLLRTTVRPAADCLCRRSTVAGSGFGAP